MCFSPYPKGKGASKKIGKGIQIPQPYPLKSSLTFEDIFTICTGLVHSPGYLCILAVSLNPKYSIYPRSIQLCIDTTLMSNMNYSHQSELQVSLVF